MLSKSEYIELQVASLTWLETYLYNRVFPKAFRIITDIKYARYLKYMIGKIDVENKRKEIWNKIMSNNS